MKSDIEHGYFSEIKAAWPRLTIFERFEIVVAYIIMLIIALIVIVALIRLGKNVFTELVFHAVDPLEFVIFQRIFGNILTLLIAIEFMHTIVGVLQGRSHIFQVKTIILIALIAIARKFIVMDKTMTGDQMLGLAVITLALGAVYWVLKWGSEHRVMEKK